jgi:hypothetical protein
MLSMNVVAAKPASPNGAGFAGLQLAPAAGSAGAGATSASRGPTFAASIYPSYLGVYVPVRSLFPLGGGEGNDGSASGTPEAANGGERTTSGDRRAALGPGSRGRR